MLNNGIGAIGINGNLADIMTDITFVVKHVYSKISKKDSEDGEIFKKFVKELLPEIAFESEEELKKRCEDQDRELKEKEDEIKKLLDELKELLK